MKTHLLTGLFFVGLMLTLSGCDRKDNRSCATICNPIDLNYNFSSDEVSRRDVAHPCVILFDDIYYLFASNVAGYYFSSDLVNWQQITDTNLPVLRTAPTVVNIEGELYYADSYIHDVVYKTKDPRSGVWDTIRSQAFVGKQEPMLFYDNGRLFLYEGFGNTVTLTGAELDPSTFQLKGSPVSLIQSDKEHNGWEKPGDQHDWMTETPWIEGAWMTKHDGKYYLQYASPGIQFKTSNNAVYVADAPLGPFRLAIHNPFAYKLNGFLTGAGNGCVFQDRYGNYWYIGTVAVTTKHFFERRLSLYPVFFDHDSIMYADMNFGDYPQIIPAGKISSPQQLSARWMILSYNKGIEVSSELRKYPAYCAVDEDIRTWWSAATGNKGEYLTVDLEEKSTIRAIQVNFADHDSELFGRADSVFYQYVIEVSDDKARWKKIVDRSTEHRDRPHDYIQLENATRARYVRITNIHFPSGKFSISGFRVFGKSDKPSPGKAELYSVMRSQEDRRCVTLKWKKVEDAVGYSIRFGSRPDKLFNTYMIYDDLEVTLRCLQTGQPYYFAIDSYNEGGVTCGDKIEKCL